MDQAYHQSVMKPKGVGHVLIVKLVSILTGLTNTEPIAVPLGPLNDRHTSWL